MLSEQQKISVRRHLGYPVTGNPIRSPVGGNTLAAGSIGYRWFQVYGMLEYRMNNLQIFEEAILLGLAEAAVDVNGQVDAVGRTASITIDQPPLSVSVTYTTTSTDDIFSTSRYLANLLLADPNLVPAGFQVQSPASGIGPFADAAKPPAVVQPYPAIQITCVNGPFQVTAVGSGLLQLIVEPGSGQFIDPVVNLGFPPASYYGYVPILNALETAIGGASDNLDTEKADVWTARKDELEVRERLYNRWRMKMSQYLQIPLWEDTGLDITGSMRAGRRNQMVA